VTRGRRREAGARGRIDQPPGREAGLPERIAAVSLSQLVFLLREVEYFAAVAQDQVVGLLLGPDEGVK